MGRLYKQNFLFLGFSVLFSPALCERGGRAVHREFLIQFPNETNTDKRVAQDAPGWTNRALCPLGEKDLAIRLFSPFNN